MENLSFTKNGNSFVSDAFSGGISVQLAFDEEESVRLVIMTSLDSSLGWDRIRNVTAIRTVVFSIPKLAGGQQFRIMSPIEPSAAVIAPLFQQGVSSDYLSSIESRISDLEDGQEPLILSVNHETGNLEQDGVSSGEFGVDLESGYLTFEN